MRERFANGISDLHAESRSARFEYPFPPEKVVELFREYFGPTKMAFASLDENGQKQLASQTESLWREHNLSSDGTTHVEAEYLEVQAVRA